MWSVSFVIVGCLTIVSGKREQFKSKGCFSTSFVDQYAFYYRINQSVPLEESFAACDNRLTKYIGLQVDKSAPYYNFVYCGNDLTEVSTKLSSGCHPCQENGTLSCGGDGSMFVYLLRDSTPFSLLLATDSGVEMFLENTTTLRVAHTNYSEYKYVDYIYTEDMIVSSIQFSLLRSFYNTLLMKYSHLYNMRTDSYNSDSLAVDWNHSTVYFGYRGDLLEFTLNNLELFNAVGDYYINVPRQISVDSYNRSLVYLKYPYDAISIFLLDERTVSHHTLEQFHVDKINALAMGIQEQLLYAILTIKGDNVTYLVSLDYKMSQMRVLFSGPHLVDATVVEVFHREVVWLRNISGTSTIYRCKLTPKCSNFTIYQTNQKVYDFTIFHPEKQTPGEKFLCGSMTCDHGCKAFSPFSARCSCPTGMDLNPNNNTCYERNSTLQTEVTSSPSFEDPEGTSPAPPISPTLQTEVTSSPSFEDPEGTSPTPPISPTLQTEVTSSPSFEDPEGTSPAAPISPTLQTEVTSSPSFEDPEGTSPAPPISPPTANQQVTTNNPPEKSKTENAGISNFNTIVMLCIFILFVCLVAVFVLVVGLYRKYTKITYVLEQRHELKELNEYVEMPILNRQ